MKHLIILTSLVIIVAINACNSTHSPPKKESPAILVDSIPKVVSKQIKEPDTIHYDNEYYPIDSLLVTKVLTTGTFHEDEVWKTASKGKWYGLFKNKEGFYLAESKVITKRIHDVVVDENESDSTGWKVQTTNKDTSILLIQSLDYLNNHPVDNIVLSSDKIFPGDTVQFTFLGLHYVLFATGGKKKVQENPDWFQVWNYKLYLKGTKNGDEITELLVAQSAFDDEMINIIFFGDIDGDKLLDLIIDTSGDYNATCPTLYLSKPAGIGHLLKVMGRHTSVGC